MGLFYKDTNGNIHTVDGSQTQFTALPTPSADLVGKIYQYIGNTTSTFTNGWFYKCVQGETAGTYEWIPVAVQSGGGSSVQSDWNQTDSTADDYIKNKPTLGTASAKDVATSGDASATQVVMGNDSRLNNSISSTSTTSPITDSADGMVQGLTIYGRSTKTGDTIHGVGEGYGSFKINDFQWSRFQWQTVYFFKSNTTIPNIKTPTDDNTIANISASFYKSETANNVLKPNYDGCISCGVDGHIYLQDNRYDNETDFINNVGDITVIYQQATPTTNTLAIKTDDGTGIGGTMAAFTTALPLRGVSGTVRDKLICTAESKQVETVCGVVDLGDLDWTYNVPNAFFVAENALINAIYGQGCICDNYAYSTARPSAMNDKCITLWTDSTIYIKDSDYTDAATFKAAVTGVKLIYPLAIPTVTPLTDAEISAFRGLKTYDSTTNITITDEPDFEIDYLKNTENGQTVAGIQKDLQGQIDEGSGSANFPAGGTTGQALVKASDADNDVEWGNISSVRIDDTAPSASTVFSSRKTDILIKTPMTGATAYDDGATGSVPRPVAGDQNKALFGDGQWHTVYSSASGSTVMVVTTETSLYGRTVTLTDGRSTLTTTMGNNGEAVFTDVSLFGNVQISCSTSSGEESKTSVNITYFGTYMVSLTLNFATIILTSTDSDMLGETVYLELNGVNVQSATFRLDGGVIKAETYVEEVGTYKANVQTNTKGQARSTFTVAALKQVYNVQMSLYRVYAFKMSKNESDPSNIVTPYDSDYGCENFNFTPAHMDYTNDTFSYGSWSALATCDRSLIFFAPKPCMLNYDGTVAYYLDPNDYTKKADGTASDITNMNFTGNAMMQFPTIYFKRWEDTNYSYCVISNKKLDNNFHAYAHHDKNGNVLPYIYISIYDGSYDGTRMRSISGCGYNTTLVSGNVMCQTTRQEEINFAMANNLAGYTGEGWYIRHKADWDMVNDLLILIGMSTDTQTTFGRGNDSGGANGCIGTGTMDNKGLFWGNNDGTSGVKVFGIENWWANIWKSIAGLINNTGTQKVKMTYGQEDGSATNGFNLDGTGYVVIPNSTPTGTTGGYVDTYYTSEYGLIPKNTGGSATTYLCDGMWYNNSLIGFALVGSSSSSGLGCGTFALSQYRGADHIHKSFGTALSHKGKVS